MEFLEHEHNHFDYTYINNINIYKRIVFIEPYKDLDLSIIETLLIPSLHGFLLHFFKTGFLHSYGGGGAVRPLTLPWFLLFTQNL